MKLIRLAAIAATALTLGACKDYLIEAPQDFLTPSSFPATEADLKIALGGIDDWYTGGSNQAYYIRGWPMLSEVPNEQTILINATSGSKYEVDRYVNTPDNEWMWRTWRQMYGAISQANILIARIPTMQVTQDVMDRYLGAAKFHRALNHFNAVRVWGDVPLILTPVTDFAAATDVARSPQKEVYTAIAADLEDAAKLLPVRWPGSATPDDGRPTRGAALTMLADVYANMSGVIVNDNHWSQAAAAAKAVIDSKTYSLVPNFADLWLVNNKNGPEHIYSIQFEGLIRNLFTSQSRPNGIGAEGGINYWCTTPEFMATFNDLDKRKKPTFLTQVTVGTTTYYYNTVNGVKGFGEGRAPFTTVALPYYGKFYDNGGQSITLNNGRSNLNWPVYRYAETLLLHAEAENEANGPANAYASINAVRARAGMSPLAGLSQAQFRDSVRQERSYELAFESKRLFDLKRWGLYNAVIGKDPVSLVGWKPEKIWAAIPQREIDLNSNLKQNPGY